MASFELGQFRLFWAIIAYYAPFLFFFQILLGEYRPIACYLRYNILAKLANSFIGGFYVSRNFRSKT